MRSKNTLPKATFESTWALIQKNTQNCKKYDQYFAEMREDRKKMDESIKAMQQELGGMGNSNGEIAESYFVNSFSNSMCFAGQQYDEIDRKS